MRFAVLCLAFCALVYAGDDEALAATAAPATVATGKVGKNGKAKAAKGKNAKAAKGKQGNNVAVTAQASAAPAQISDRMLPVTMAASAAYSPAVTAPASVTFRPSCPHNNCQSCTSQPGCYWTGGGCTNMPCSIYGPCAITTAQCGGCRTDSQCGGAPRRCENGQCVGVEGDKACDYYLDCAGCLTRPNCLWDPNTVTGSCKPKEQCDFTYQQRELVLSAPVALPPATACVRTVDRCGAQNLNGAPLDLNTNRGVGCTNHGQCNPDQYCYSCSKCKGSCSRCQTPGVPVSGMCGPAWRCPIDGDSISQTCPIIRNPVILPPVVIPPPPVVLPQPPVAPPVVRPPANTCSSFLNCGPCTNAYGCVWSGRDCYYTTVPCTNVGCANTPQQCPRTSAPAPIPSPATTHQKVLADDMNKQSGFPVIVVDYFQGTALPPALLTKMLPVLAPQAPDTPKPSLLGKCINFICTLCIAAWYFPTLALFLFRHRKPPLKTPVVARVAEELKGGSKRKLGVVGYCYGGFFSFALGQSTHLFECVVIAHSQVTLADVAKLKAPTLFVCAENDWAFPEKLIPQVDELLRSRSDFSEHKFRIRRYPGTYHGFAIRGDERNPKMQAAKATALTDVVTMFQNFLGSRGNEQSSE